LWDQPKSDETIAQSKVSPAVETIKNDQPDWSDFDMEAAPDLDEFGGDDGFDYPPANEPKTVLVASKESPRTAHTTPSVPTPTAARSPLPDASTRMSGVRRRFGSVSPKMATDSALDT